MTERPTAERLAEIRSRHANVSPDYRDATTTALLAEVDALRHDVAAASLVRSMGEECKACAMADREREHLMHDTAKAVASAEVREERTIAERDTAIARAVAAEQRAETVELALTALREVAIPLVGEAAEEDVAGLCENSKRGYNNEWREPCGKCAMCHLASVLRATPTDLAEALRRELRAEGMEEARALVNAELQTEAVSRDRAYAAGRTEVGSHRQACVEALESATHRIDTRAAELRGPK